MSNLYHLFYWSQKQSIKCWIKFNLPSLIKSLISPKNKLFKNSLIKSNEPIRSILPILSSSIIFFQSKYKSVFLECDTLRWIGNHSGFLLRQYPFLVSNLFLNLSRDLNISNCYIFVYFQKYILMYICRVSNVRYMTENCSKHTKKTRRSMWIKIDS